VRRTLAAAACALAVAVVAGCGGGDEIVGLDRVGDPDAPRTLVLQVNADFSPQAAVPEQAKGFRDLFARWARRHPQWRVDLNIIPGAQSTSEQARLLEKARVGRAPDCANVDSFTVPLFVQQKVLTPIDRFVPKAERDDLLPYVRDVMTGPDGRIYAYWWSTDLRVLWRNTELMPKAPKTTDELIEFAKAAEKKNPKVDGYLFNGGRWEGTTFDNLAFFWMQGGKLLGDDGEPIFASGENRQKLVNELAFLQQAVKSGVSPARVATITDYSEFETAAAGGTAASFLGGSFQYPALEASLPKKEFEKWDFSAIPGLEPGQYSTGAGGWTMAALTKDPAKVEACMSIIREIYIGEGNELTGQLPTTRRLYETLPTFKEPVYKRFRELAQEGQARPGLAIYPELSNQMQIAIGSVLTGESTPEQAVANAGERVQQAYDLLAGD